MIEIKLMAAALAMLVPAAAFAADAGCCCCGADKACCKDGADCCDKIKTRSGDPKPAPMPGINH